MNAHSLTLVLSSPRSGSSLLCRDLESLGGLGAPREYVRDLGPQERRGAVTEEDVLERVARGCRDSAPGVAAVKLMAPQSQFTYEAIAGQRAATAGAALSGVVTWARERFDKVFLVVLVRNAVDQAISRVVAQETGIFHSTDRRFRESGEAPLDVDNLNELVLLETERVLRNRGVLSTVLAHHADLALLLTYDELIGQVETTTKRIVTHATAQGFEVQHDTVTRKLSKVISPARTTDLRASFVEYLMTEPGA